MKLNLTQVERDNIKQLHCSCPQRFADKLKAILLLHSGFSCVEVGQILLLDNDSVRQYREMYLSHGAESLLTDNNNGRKSNLRDSQKNELESHLEQNTYCDRKGIMAWIAKHFNIDYSKSGLTALLKRTGFVYKKPVLVPCKANTEKQVAFVGDYKKLKIDLGPGNQIYFVDGVHPQHNNSTAAYGWIKRGRTKHLMTNNGRQRTNINGPINLETKQVMYVEDEMINAQIMIGPLVALLKNQKEGKIHIFMDNARYYHALIVKGFLIENPRIVLHFMPPYSPNLNIIERLWKILKKEVVHNKFYLKFEDFSEAVIKFFEDKLWMHEKFDKILIDTFEIIKPNFSASYLGWVSNQSG